MLKTIRFITGFLGISMLMFGVLKFADPFKSWYNTQIIMSDLPFPVFSFWSGQTGEILVGLSLLCILYFGAKASNSLFSKLFVISHVGIIVMMLVAVYVHLQPNVPADVLPLKIRPPYIPGIFLVLATLNLYLKSKIK